MDAPLFFFVIQPIEQALCYWLSAASKTIYNTVRLSKMFLFLQRASCELLEDPKKKKKKHSAGIYGIYVASKHFGSAPRFSATSRTGRFEAG